MADQFPIRRAPFLIRKFLEWGKFDAITAPWGVIYLVPDAYKDYAAPMNEIGLQRTLAVIGLVDHERVHEAQIKREGPWKFTAKYLWYLLRHGYWNNPYEKEARGEK